MTQIVWDEWSQSTYRRGVQKGVVYLRDGRAVPWNGLVSVEHQTIRSTEPVHFDGTKIHDRQTVGSLSGSIEAYTYPNEFEEVTGFREPMEGVWVGEQLLQTFDMSYQTLVQDKAGNSGYTIHCLYNLKAVPGPIANLTIGEGEGGLVTFSWTITGTPGHFPGYRPSSQISFNSLKAPPAFLDIIETRLYGGSTANPDFPSYSELMQMIDEFYLVEIIDHNDGTWTARTDQPNVIYDEAEGAFRLVGMDADYLDADTFVVRSSKE